MKPGKKQRCICNEEHRQPVVLLQMDSDKPSSGVTLFWEWMSKHPEFAKGRGLEIGCGKGRNCIWLAQQGVDMTGLDFAESAIAEATRRAGGIDSVRFAEQDVTEAWPVEAGSLDFVVDCFASTDIDSPEGRAAALGEIEKALKQGGLLFIYTLSTEDSFHKELIKKSPAKEANALLHPSTGKFEKVFSEAELRAFYKDFEWLAHERVEKVAQFYGKDYPCRHHWLILQKA